MTRRWIANTDLIITAGEKGIFFKKIVFTVKKGIWLLRALREAYGLLWKGNQVICYKILHEINIIS